MAGYLLVEFGIPLDDLPTETIRALGIARVAHQLAQLGHEAMQHAIGTGRIRSDASGYMIPVGQ